MINKYRFQKSTCHAKYDIEMEALISEASDFNLIYDELDKEDGTTAYKDAILKGVFKGLEVIGKGTNFNIDLKIKDLSGETPPYGYEECVRELISRMKPM